MEAISQGCGGGEVKIQDGFHEIIQITLQR